MFERAAKRKLRFTSSKGSLSVEDLYDLSLTSLDSIAKGVNRQLKAEAEERTKELMAGVGHVFSGGHAGSDMLWPTRGSADGRCCKA